jgi:TPP-dependent pyruvate/acetoin dehydrogenase alpha subunit
MKMGSATVLDAEKLRTITGIGKTRLAGIYESMQRIRVFEERVARLFAAGKVPGFVHLYVGEEAVAVGVCAHLRNDDYIGSTHRGHGHCLAKGADVERMMAELFGKSTGLCGGRGGSMHVADASKGILGAVPIVGGGVPLALGPGLTAKVKGTDQVSVAFFGDGAVNQGVVSESLNLASVWKLPVIFVCENNLYAQSTPSFYHLSIDSVADRGAAFGMPGVKVDGMDVFKVYEAAGEAIARARRGEGPTLVEACTYRFRAHFEGDPAAYRSAEELEYHKGRDPIAAFRRDVLEAGILKRAELDVIDAAVRAEIDKAVSYAEASPMPDPAELEANVY